MHLREMPWLHLVQSSSFKIFSNLMQCSVPVFRLNMGQFILVSEASILQGLVL